MSKSAIATLNKAAATLATAGVVVDLVAYLNDGKARTVSGKKLWRNADKLAALIVDSAANAFQCENSTTFADNHFDSMADAVDRYISSNLDDWSQSELEDCSSFWKVDQLARLAEMVQRNVAFEAMQADHAEALEMDKQATHFRREQAALTERVRAIMTPAESDEDRLNREYNNTMTGIETMNKAKAKQQQTPANLPKPQMIDVLRAALRTQAAATDAHIEAVGDMTETQLRKAINSITAKGVRVTAHLVKAKRYGYGALTFGINGQLPPGSYHALQVKSMKDARETATRYGAMMWNF